MPNRAEIVRWLTEAVARLTDQHPESVDPTVPWTAYGVSSVEAVSLSGELEEVLGVPLPATLVYEHASIVALADHLAAAVRTPERPAGAGAGGTAGVNGTAGVDGTVGETAGGDGPAGPEVPAGPSSGDEVCVVGLGCRFPGGTGAAEFWRTLAEGVSRSGPVPAERWDADAWYSPDPDAPGRSYARHGAFVDDIAGFDAAFFDLSPREALRMDPRQRMLLEVAYWALEDAGLPLERLRGSRTGVFVGAMASGEYSDTQRDADVGCLDDPSFGIGSAESVLAGRLSYLFDLRGPCLTVDTACSSSLVAAHLARESLLRGESDLAIVAGVSAVLRPQTVQQACKARMLAADGRCKTFDATADGFLMGEGCGVVVLERAADAAARRRRPLAVLRGSAVNQDGRSNGLTAPSGTAQRAVIRAALASAGVRPHEISFLEAHGSATALGDATELAAILDVFGSDRHRSAPLHVGAVKTNVGHLLGAAGIAGLIKVVLALAHQRIPANLHLHAPNPAVPWDPATVALPSELTPWEPPSGRRLAGVSSFGWSGTNAHVVVGEPNQDRPQTGPGGAVAAPGGPHVLLLSGRDRAALAARSRDLLASLDAEPHLDLADVAFTTQTGLSALDHRAAVLCADRAEANTGLAAVAAGRLAHHTRRGTEPPVALLLPGIGDQHVGMGRQLFAANPVFRAAVDRCADALREPLGLDLRDVLYPAQAGGNDTGAIDLAAMLGRTPGPAETAGLERLDIAHAAIFTIDYACAALWQDLGVGPHAVLGYSLGELVAACLAGVFTLPAAAVLVARRAQVIGRVPAGAMLAVAEDATALRARLGPEASIAAENGPLMSVVAGPVAAIAGLERDLAAAGVVSRRIPTGQPMHTPLMSAVRADIERFVAEADPRPPRLPFVSNLTGTVIRPGEDFPPHYWADQVCSPVRFRAAVDALLADGVRVLVEAGPGQTLSYLAGQAGGGDRAVLALPTLPAATDPRAELTVVTHAAGELWCRGVTVEPGRLRGPGRSGRIVGLPPYPFSHTRYWPETVARTLGAPDGATPGAPGGIGASGAGRGGDRKRPDIGDWCHVQTWRRIAADTPDTDAGGRGAPATTLLVADPLGVAARLAGSLASAGHPVITVSPGTGYEVRDQHTVVIDPGQPDHHLRLLRDLAGRDLRPDRVVYAAALRTPGSPVDPDRAAATVARGFHGLLSLVRAIGQGHGGACEIVAVSNNAVEVAGHGIGCPDQATLWGAHRSITAEYQHLTSRYVDLDLADGSADAVRRAADCLARELGCAPVDEAVAWRDGHRWVRDWSARRVEPTQHEVVWRTGGGYLITGGTGGLGLALARHLARSVRARMVLVGRTPLPELDERQSWLDERGPDDPVSRCLLALREIEEAGGEAHVIAADCTDEIAMRTVVAECRRRLGRLDGVVHAAGVPGGGLIQARTAGEAAAVLAPKVHGTLVLDAVLGDLPVDFVALYSSAVVAFGGLGESDYCAANAFLDAYARCATSRRGQRWLAVSWAPWRWDAWQAAALAGGPEELHRRVRDYRDRFGITEAEGAEVLTRLLATDLSHALVLPEDLAATTTRWRELLGGAIGAQPPPHQQRYARPDLRTPFVAPNGPLETRIAEVWQEFLGLDRVGTHDPFFELGGNSLVGLAIIARLERQLGRSIAAASLFQYPTVSELAKALSPEGGTPALVVADSERGRRRAQAHAAAARRKSART